MAQEMARIHSIYPLATWCHAKYWHSYNSLTLLQPGAVQDIGTVTIHLPSCNLVQYKILAQLQLEDTRYFICPFVWTITHI